MMTTTADRISFILLCGAYEKVRWVYASRGITRMPHMQPCRDFTLMKGIGEPVGGEYMAT
jgi:hypothetical protein